MKYRKKPVVVDAIQYTGNNCREILRFIGSPHGDNSELHDTDQPVIHTTEGDMTTSAGDWVIRGTQGEFYPCKPKAFADTFEPVEDSPR